MATEKRTVPVERWSRLTGERITTQRVEVKCCGEWMLCDAFTTTCHHCGADYNMSGQLLAPRSQWGEETGEHWTDCY